MVLDRSGSMSGQWSDIEGGYPQLIKEQREEEGTCTFSLVAFDGEIEFVEDFQDIHDVSNKLSVFPRGSTSLRDAIGQAITETGNKLRNLDEDQRPEKVIFMIQTDGYENTSREYNQSQIQNMIKEQEEKYNWKFLFLGADESCLNQAHDLGFAAANSTTYAGGKNYTRGVGSKLKMMRSASMEEYAASVAFTEEEKADLDS